MKTNRLAVVALMSAFCVPVAPAEDLKSGIAVGGAIPTYQAVKCGGIDDGVKAGASLCYT